MSGYWISGIEVFKGELIEERQYYRLYGLIDKWERPLPYCAMVFYDDYMNFYDKGERKIRSAFLKFMMSFDHPNILKIYNFSKVGFKGDHNLTLLVDKFDNLTLADKINELSTEQQYKIIDGIGRGLYELHRIGIIHFELTPHSIFLKKDFTPVIADASFIGFFRSIEDINNIRRYSPFLSLDIYDKETDSYNFEYSSFPDDVLSYGFIVFAIFTKYPIFDMKAIDMMWYRLCLSVKHRWDLPLDYPKLVHYCCTYRHQRYTMEQVLEFLDTPRHYIENF